MGQGCMKIKNNFNKSSIEAVTYPKVLIVGESFHTHSGGGITQSNLFKFWPKDNIAIIPYVKGTTDPMVCDRIYSLHEKDIKYLFPFNILNKISQNITQNAHEIQNSNLISKIDQGSETKDNHYSQVSVKKVGNLAKRNKKSKTGAILKMFYRSINDFFGFEHVKNKIVVSPDLIKWIGEFKPEIIYAQFATLDKIRFVYNLKRQTNLPLVIHMMDDWPSTISNYGLFKKYWNTRIDQEFRQLLGKVDLYLSISDAMSEEYLRRYHKQFKAFHNPVDIDQFKLPRGERLLNGPRFRILYIGRIGTANKQTIISFAGFVSRFKISNLVVEFDIFTKEAENTDLISVGKLDNVHILPPVSHDQVPALLMDYNLLLLPLDFTEAGLKFAKFSMPTKASEYMLSGTPVLIIAPQDTTVSRFFSENECGYCVSKLTDNEFDKALRFLILNGECRSKISRKAIELAKERFDGEKVRKEFQKLLLDLSKRDN